MPAAAASDAPRRHAYTLPEINDMLTARADDVARHYAPEVRGSYSNGQQYFTLNPGRPDTRVGSFWINLSGPHAGRWRDMATGQGGDLIDLIALALNCSKSDAIREARAYLGLSHDDPARARRREAEIARQKVARAEAEARRAADLDRVRAQALAIWLSAQADIAGGPVGAYLAARGIDLAALPRPVTALRYLPDCYYKLLDPETGEIIERRLPAMVACAVNLRGKTQALHRTYLGIHPRSGLWSKADLPNPKKVMGPQQGAAIRVWSGIGPRGGKPGPLAEAPPGARVMIAEGIEDALVAAIACPEARVLAAINLDNLGRVELPASVTEVTLIADNDAGEQARAMFDRAVAAHAAQGRTVRVWRNARGGKDLNDALRAMQGGA